jgi:hypothetical protein
VVKTVNKFRTRIPNLKHYYSPDFDILGRVIQIQHRLFKNTNLCIILKHVKGHQNQQKQTLTYEAKLNIQADILATK